MGTGRQWQVSECLNPCADLLPTCYWWKLTSVCGLALPTSTHIQHKQLLTVDCLAAPNKELRATHRKLLNLQCNTTQEILEPTYLVAGFRPQQSTTWLVPQMAHPKEGVSRYQIILWRIQLLGVSPHMEAPILWLEPILAASQCKGQPT